MGLRQKYEDAWKAFAAEKNHYWSDATQTGYGCSSGTCRCLRDAGIIKSNESFHAASGYEGVLADTTRFQKIKFDTSKVQWMDILIKWGYHTATYAGDSYISLWECAPESTHSVATNGTGCGLHRAHTLYNCGTGSVDWDYIYRIIEEDETMTPSETVEIYMAKGDEIANNDTYGYNNTPGSNLGPDFGLKNMDCGAFVSTCLRAAGLIGANTVLEPNTPTGTWGYDTILTAAGFRQIAFNSATVKRGDVLIRDGHHTELAYGNNKSIGAHNDYDGGKSGDTYGNEISVVGLASNWDYMYRLKGFENDSSASEETTEEYPTLKVGSSGEAVKKLQTILNNKISAGLAVDGSFGNLTKAAVIKYQNSVGLYADAIVGPLTWAELLKSGYDLSISAWQTAAKADGLYKGTVDGLFGNMSYVAACTAIIISSRYTNLVKFWQQFLKAKGDYTGDIDGSFGPLTKSAVMACQKAYGIDSDGCIGPISCKTFLGIK